jgi:hypothetical protein
MNLKEYFKNENGIGVLSTADAQGMVNSAVYSRPHIMEDGTAAFIMTSRLSYQNVQANPQAAYLFIEKASGYVGKRLRLTKVKETDDASLIASLRTRSYQANEEQAMKPLHLVYFRIEEERPLIGEDGAL